MGGGGGGVSGREKFFEQKNRYWGENDMVLALAENDLALLEIK